MKINCTIFRFLDQALWAFEDALQTGKLKSSKTFFDNAFLLICAY